ncbi:MAG: hypothetical protein C0404_06020 [Verrucomicrobia bacterium]|nr:hypothetical protein [Verrucomicrobiota bacterium]
MASKINQLLKEWPRGTVTTASWLSKRGVYRQLTRQYVLNEWLEPVGRGAFLRAGEDVEWLGAIYTLQKQLGLSVHPAAGTALFLKGLGHFLPMGKDAEVLVFSEHKETLPRWFLQHPWGARIRHSTPGLFDLSDPTGLTEFQHGDFSVWISAPERAILETFHLATTNASIDLALELMRGLTTLRPRVVQSLLEACRSIKAKRAFLWAAELSGHQWLPRLAVDRLNLGSGKRLFYRDGEFSAKYSITVPKTERAHV